VAYDEFIKLANEADNKAAETYFSQSRDVESFHAKLYKEAMNNMMEERETTYYICEVCGYPSDGVLPDECPVCGAKKEKFYQFE
jgi:rubrerythrin